MKALREYAEFFGIDFDRRLSDWDVDWLKTAGGRKTDSRMNEDE